MNLIFSKKIKKVNQITHDISVVTRYEALNLAIIELNIFGVISDLEQAKIYARLDKLSKIGKH